MTETVTATKPAEFIAALEKHVASSTDSWWKADWTFVPAKHQASTVFAQTVKEMEMLLATTTTTPLTPEQLDLYPAELDLTVGMSDIMNGIPGNPAGCAVALAVARRFDGAVSHVGNTGITIISDHSGSLGVRYMDPSGEMTRFIGEYDRPFRAPDPTDWQLRFTRASERVSPTTLHLIRC
jgi:hypothetical protein